MRARTDTVATGTGYVYMLRGNDAADVWRLCGKRAAVKKKAFWAACPAR